MGLSKTKIINVALGKLGAKSVVNIDTDDTRESRIALNFYDFTLEQILSEALWGFAQKRVKLATTEDTIPFNVNYQNLKYCYQKPTDCIRIFETNDVGAEWVEEGDKILSDSSDLGIIYIYLNTNTIAYPPTFIAAFTDLLAYNMAYDILNSDSKLDMLIRQYQGVSLPKAKTVNAQTGSLPEVNDNFWLNSRTGGPLIKEFS